jgi:UDP-glucose 4-epimerase
MSVSPLRLFITGGRGRLASLMADHFRAPQHRVSLFSRTTGPSFSALDELLDPSRLPQADVVLHLAWSSLPATAEQHPGLEERHDLPWLDRFLAAQAACPVNRRPHLIFFSSGGAVYGNAPGRPNREDDPCRPLGHYGQAKLAAEQRIAHHVALTGAPATVLRISNPYGYPVPRGRAQGIIPHAVRAAAENRPLTLWGDGSARKDFLYYTDFLDALAAIVALRPTGTFNLGAGESHSIREILELVTTHTDRPIVTTTQPAPAWDVQDSRLDIARLRSALDWQPQISLDEGIRRSTVGFMEH